MIGAPPSPTLHPTPSNPSSLLTASPSSPLPTLPMDRTASSSSAVSGGSTTYIILHLLSQFTYRHSNLGSTDEDRSPPSQIRAKPTHTVLKIKNAVNRNWPGRPKVEGIRLIHSGRVLLDHERVADVVTSGQTEAYLHLVVRPDAWSDLDQAPLTPSGLRSGRTTPAPALSAASSIPSRLLRPRVDPLEGSSYFLMPSESNQSLAQDSHTLASTHKSTRLQSIAQLDSLPKVLSISYVLYYHRYEVLYNAFEGKSLSASQEGLETLYVSLGLTNAGARQALTAVERQIFGWTEWRDVIPASSNLEPLLRECCHRVDELRTMLQDLKQLPVSPDPSHETQNVTAQPIPTAAAVPPTPTVSPTTPASSRTARTPVPFPTPIELFTLLLPVAFLAMKLAILLYVFTRGASPRKKWMMYSVAYLWIAFEMIMAWRKRNRRVRSAQRRAARDANGTATQPGGRGGRSSRRRSASRANPSVPTNNSGPGVPSAPRRFTVQSPSQPRFWLQRLAFLGMEEEDLELGLRPTSSQAHLWLVRIARERSAAQRRASRGYSRARIIARLDLSRVLNELTFPIVLYLATLIPEVEELRMEEVRKRERLIRKWWTEKGSKWVEDRRREKISEQQQGAEGGNSLSDRQTTTQPVELPRLLKHPYILRLLCLKASPDGLVEPLDPSRPLAGGGDRIDIQEELDAMRALERRDEPAEGDVAGAEDGGPESEEAEEDAAAEGAEDDFGFF